MNTFTQKIRDLSIKAAVKKELLKATLQNSNGEVVSSEGGKVAITVGAVLAIIILVGVFLKTGGEFETDAKDFLSQIWD